MTAPRISIVTPSFQQAAYLEACLASVHDAQGAVRAEHIVVDGGSTDGSAAIIAAHADRLGWWCSEVDQGQSDAINKGLAHATCEVFNWLNSDDLLEPGTLERVQQAFASDPDLLVLGGRVDHLGPTGRHPFPRLNEATDADQLFNEPVINQPATFWRTDVVRTIGGVDPALRYVMDLELWWQLLFRSGTRGLRFIPDVLAVFRLHDASKTSTAMLGFLDEIASLLAGLCDRTDNTDLAGVLRTGHVMRPGLRGIPAGHAERDRVRRMTLHFLLKWNTEIHRQNQFEAMQALRSIGVDEGVLTAEQRQRWQRIQDQLRVGSWKLFRVKRKLKRLLP